MTDLFAVLYIQPCKVAERQTGSMKPASFNDDTISLSFLIKTCRGECAIQNNRVS